MNALFVIELIVLICLGLFSDIEEKELQLIGALSALILFFIVRRQLLAFYLKHSVQRLVLVFIGAAVPVIFASLLLPVPHPSRLVIAGAISMTGFHLVGLVAIKTNREGKTVEKAG